MIAVIDYGAGNLLSVTKALAYLQVEAVVVASGRELAAIDATVEKCLFPGVGAFDAAVKELKQRDLFEPLQSWLEADRPFLGICLGMQLLLDTSEEAPGTKGLAFIPGDVVRFVAPKVPQIGWNQVSYPRPCTLFDAIEEESYFYFVHSFYVRPSTSAVAIGVTEYGGSYVSAINHGNVYGVQFHPEKSGAAGLQLLKNWVSM